MRTPVTEHFSIEEFGCRDGTPYPLEWISQRLEPLCLALEALRDELGSVAIHVDSGYRTIAYNATLQGAAPHSQHVEGRAADIVTTVAPAVVHATALRLYQAGRVKIGGLGFYATFTHIDVRPGERLAQWTGSRVRN